MVHHINNLKDKKTHEYLNRFSLIRGINIVKMSIKPKAVYRFNAIPIKLLMVFFTELQQIISQFVWKHKKTLNSQSNLEKEWNWTNQPSWIHTVLQSYSHQNSMVLIERHKYRSLGQLESPDIHSCTYRNLIFDKGGKNIQWRKGNLFNKWCWKKW